MHRVVSDYTKVEGVASNIKVYVRARPLEVESEQPEFLVTDSKDDRKIVIKDPDASNRRYGETSFQFDKVFWKQTTQEEIFSITCKPQVDHVLEGYNCCCFAYGQTGSGKTYTMFGTDGEIRGVIPRSVEYLFQCIAKKSGGSEIAIVCSFLEIYNDAIRDLGKAYLVGMGGQTSSNQAIFEKTSDIFENLAGKRGNPYFAPAFHRAGSSVAVTAEARPGLKEVQDEYNTMNYEIREDNGGNVFVKDLSLIPVNGLDEVMSLINTGLRVRATHETKMNATSSRSHTVFTITVLQKDKITGQTISGMLNLVDLAGCERLKKSESVGIRLKEALHINTSLTALGKVIMALDPSTEMTHVPYRDSKLTRVLQNSLGGNSYTNLIANIHPNVTHYEECLSTLQFANRCRNVKNNPKVNYIDDNDDKDKKIRKLMDELGQLRLKVAQSSTTDLTGKGGSGLGGSGEDKMSVSKLIALLKKLGINASLSPDGQLLINGQKYALDELGIAITSDRSISSELSQANIDNIGGGGKYGASGGGANSLAGLGVEKLQKMIQELKASNVQYNTKAKERKVQMEAQGRELQNLSVELVKCQTTIKHKEFEYDTLLKEKERCVKEMKLLMETKHEAEVKRIMHNNHEILLQQKEDIDKIPNSVRDYTTLLSRAEKSKTQFEGPLRVEFDSHLHQLEKSRLLELDNVKEQYEHWLVEKDRALSGFVDRFNAYRAKKAEQLRMAEREIVRLYAYTEQIEQILDNVEKGKYQVQQKQGARGGKSTTGVLAMSQQQTGGGRGNNNGPVEEGTLGAVMIPAGVRPTNPLKVTTGVSSKDLELTKRIVEKHKERVNKMDKMKEEAFQKSLHYAAQTGATAAGTIDPTLEKQIHDLLVSKVNNNTSNNENRRSGIASGGSSRPKTADASRGPSSPTSPTANLPPKHPRNLTSNNNNNNSVSPVPVMDFDDLDLPIISSSLNNNNNLNKLRPNTSFHNNDRSNNSNNNSNYNMNSHNNSNQDIRSVTAPAGLQKVRINNNVEDMQDGTLSPGKNSYNSTGNNYYPTAEMEDLKLRYKIDQLNTHKIMEELASNETLLYIQKLEHEIDKLKGQLKDVTSQLHTAKIANASLNRKLGKPELGTTATNIA